jgi:hypothetical protein
MREDLDRLAARTIAEMPWRRLAYDACSWAAQVACKPRAYSAWACIVGSRGESEIAKPITQYRPQ